MSLEEFLAWESTQPAKHEFVDGDVFAMAGASRAHGRSRSRYGSTTSTKTSSSAAWNGASSTRSSPAAAEPVLNSSGAAEGAETRVFLEDAAR
jgi:hypothetical protein